MFLKNAIAALIIIASGLAFCCVVGESPKFRVFAPEFVCPNDEETVFERPDNTIITIKSDASDLQFSWSVRWRQLERPSQRLTLLVWRTVRDLEAKINAPQPEPFVFVIDNSELLQGVEYTFNVTASAPGSDAGTTKSFSIDNIQGDRKLTIEGRSDKFSVLLVGAETVYTDMDYVVEAQVTTCSPTQDYFFVWSVQSGSSSPLNVSTTPGWRLELPPYSLQAGATYHVGCTVYRNSGDLVTRTGLPFQVLYRGLAAFLNFDVLVVTVNNGFDVKAVVVNHDYYTEVPQFLWKCVFESKPCENLDSLDGNILSLPRGLPHLGQYEISVAVTLQEQRAAANATIYVVEPILPVIQVQSHSRKVNEHSTVTLAANATNLAPSCALTWYFANEQFLASLDLNVTCDDCQHGYALSDSVTIFSLEENFLNELADFSNVTEWRLVTAELVATAGRARLVAQCGCSLTFSCDTQGIVYGDVHFELNGVPKVVEIKVSPETGTAMETVFRLSTLAASDADKPLRYSFYCSLGTNNNNNNNTLQLGSYLEHLAVDSFLPYVGGAGTGVWVEVCDSLGACSSSEVKTVQLLVGAGRTVQALLDTVRGHVDRCETILLRRLVQSAVTTYKNSNQVGVLSMFSKTLLDILPTAEESHCIKNGQDYLNFWIG